MSKEAKNFIKMMKAGILPPIESAENCKGLTKMEGEQMDRLTDNRFVNRKGTYYVPSSEEEREVSNFDEN